jgi:hypothetical protein
LVLQINMAACYDTGTKHLVPKEGPAKSRETSTVTGFSHY